MIAAAAVDEPSKRDVPRALVGKKRSALTVAIYNVFYWPYLIGTCAIFFWPALAIFLTTVFWDRNLRILHRFTTWWGGHYLLWAPLVATEIRGREKLFGQGPF